MENTKLDYAIQKTLKLEVDQKYYPFDINAKQSEILNDTILIQFQDKFTVLDGLMKKFSYASDGNDNENDNENIDELKIQENSHLFINDFNNENLIKSIELQENIANSVLTSSYFTLRLS